MFLKPVKMISVFLIIGIVYLSASTQNNKLIAQTMNNSNEVSNYQTATLAGGCFWCLEPIFEELQGVQQVDVGYSGGDVPNPTYRQVTTGRTGHAEVIQLSFDPEIISYEEILTVFFTIHDPTQLNRQGPDVGTQYRSAVFYHNDSQRQTSEKVIQDIEEADIWDGSIVTEVTPFEAFYIAEDYHQEYFEKNPNQAYCQVIIAPKVAKFRQEFEEKLKEN